MSDTKQMKIEDPCDNKIKAFFTSEDLVSTMEYFKDGNTYTLQGMIQYFNAKYKCNRIVKLLREVLDNGIKILPKVMFTPVTEKCKVKDNKFALSQRPYKMGDYYFLNNLVHIKYLDGTSDFFDNVEYDEELMVCNVPDASGDGFAYVSYFVLQYKLPEEVSQ